MNAHSGRAARLETTQTGASQPKCHAVAGAIREAKRCRETGEPKTLLFNLSGHGHFDMASYDRYFAGELEDYEYPAEAIKESLAHLPDVQTG